MMSSEELRRFDAKLKENANAKLQLASLGVEAHKVEIINLWRLVRLEMSTEHFATEEAGSSSTSTSMVNIAATAPRPFEELVPAGQNINGELLLSAADIMTTDRADELIVKGALVEIRGLKQ